LTVTAYPRRSADAAHAEFFTSFNTVVITASTVSACTGDMVGIPPSVQPPQQRHRAVAVADVGGGHLDLADQAEGVDQQVALAAVELLVAVVAVPPPGRWS
jgi:hypothetical protein